MLTWYIVQVYTVTDGYLCFIWTMLESTTENGNNPEGKGFVNSAQWKSCSVERKMTDASGLLNMIKSKIWISLDTRSVGNDGSCCQCFPRINCHINKKKWRSKAIPDKDVSIIYNMIISPSQLNLACAGTLLEQDLFLDISILMDLFIYICIAIRADSRSIWFTILL